MSSSDEVHGIIDRVYDQADKLADLGVILLGDKSVDPGRGSAPDASRTFPVAPPARVITAGDAPAQRALPAIGMTATEGEAAAPDKFRVELDKAGQIVVTNGRVSTPCRTGDQAIAVLRELARKGAA